MDKSLFKEKVILITGAGKGAGRALAEALAERGVCVAANDISPINVEEVVAEINAHGGQAKAFVDDVAKKVAVQALIKNVEDEFGRIDGLIVHAAVEPHTPLLDMDEWDWHRTLDVNLTGAFLMIQSAGRVMRTKGRGVIINIVPGAEQKRRPELAAGLQKARVAKFPHGERGRNDAAAYSSSMAGLRELSRTAERELSPLGIRVYTVENRGSEKTVEAVMSIFEEAWR